MKLRLIKILFVLLVLLAPVLGFSAGTCTESYDATILGATIVTFTCTGDAANGSVPNTAFSTITMTRLKEKVHYLILAEAYPTAGGTAPDAADVFLLDANNEDYLGSADGGTTANKGANLIHATLKKSAIPYSYNMSSFYFFPVTSNLTLKVSNQATQSANFTIKFTFVE
jgi:hypothetical protein